MVKKMAPNFNYQNDDLDIIQKPNTSMGAIDMLKRDRFELLSAYLDGEVTAAERRQVQEWLAKDKNVQSLYKRLLQLRQGIQSMPVPASSVSADETAKRIFNRIDRKRTLVFGGSAIAAMFIGIIYTMTPGGKSFVPQFAAVPTPETQTSAQPLMIALNRPVVDIPKAAVAPPEKPGMKLNLNINQNKNKH